jgi:hypothetical protein
MVGYGGMWWDLVVGSLDSTNFPKSPPSGSIAVGVCGINEGVCGINEILLKGGAGVSRCGPMCDSMRPHDPHAHAAPNGPKRPHAAPCGPMHRGFPLGPLPPAAPGDPA